MSNNNFEAALQLVLKQEGGYSNDAHDPGGKTNFGIIQTEYNSFRRMKGATPQDVKLIDQDEVHEIYKTLYWDKVWGDKLPSGLDYAIFDYAVNSGPHRAITDLQALINKTFDRTIEVDGNIGCATLDAVTDIQDVHSFINTYCENRRSFLRRLKTWQYFGKGWDSRVTFVKEHAREMVDDCAELAKPDVPNLGGAADRPANPSTGATAISIGAVVTGASTAVAQNVTNPYALAAFLVLLLLAGFAAYRKLA